MPTEKFVTLLSDKLSETVANLALSVFTKEDIWCQKLTQSGKYRGIKVCITSRNYKRVNHIIAQAKVYVERAKHLRDKNIPKVTDQSVLSDKEQLNTLLS